MERWLLVVARGVGGLIGYVDSRPRWDDTGVTVGALLVVTGLLGLIAPRRPWVWGLAVGVWIPALEIALTRNFASLIALPIALGGAYAGMAVRKALRAARVDASLGRG